MSTNTRSERTTARKIVGSLDVVSAEGEGTTFTMTLPCSARHRGQVPPSH